MSGISCHIRYLRYSYFVLNVIVYILNYFMINHCYSVTSLCFILRPCIYHSRFLNEVFSVFIMFTNLKDLHLSLILLSWYTALLLIRWHGSSCAGLYWVEWTSETDKYNSQGTSSFTAITVVFDALQTAIIEEINYKNGQFALIHPAGAVGKRLKYHAARI